MTVGGCVDVSSSNHPTTAPIDWQAVKAAGVTTAIVKATEGFAYTNPWYARDMAGAAAVGIDTLAYHFAAYGTAKAEAAYFASVAGKKARVLDGETTANPAWDNAFFAALGISGSTAMDYHSASAWAQLATMPTVNALKWVAAYNQGYPGYGVLWQWRSSGTVLGITGNVDLSRWYGTDSQYEQLFALNAPPPPTVPTPPIQEATMQQDVMADGTVVISGLRTGPQATSPPQTLVFIRHPTGKVEAATLSSAVPGYTLE